MDYLIYVGAALAGLAFLSFLLDLMITRNNEVELYKIIRVKNKVRKSRRYCYPKVVTPGGTEFYVYSAKRNGHDKYVEGEELEFYAPGLFNRKPRCKVGFYKRTINLLVTAVLVVAFYFFRDYI